MLFARSSGPTGWTAVARLMMLRGNRVWHGRICRALSSPFVIDERGRSRRRDRRPPTGNSTVATAISQSHVKWTSSSKRVFVISACKIVYIVDESEPILRFGLACGTLPGHAASGEERFLIECDRDDNSVWYDILAFSRPNYFLTWLGYPIVRRTQKCFGRESAAAILKAVR
jgi:uncharacterized protein (UPF0548 family)